MVPGLPGKIVTMAFKSNAVTILIETGLGVRS